MENIITRIKVNKLFGFLNHDIPIMEDGVTLIHGPNGCGKTSLLKLVAAFYEWDLQELFNVNYESMEFYYNDGKKIVITKSLNSKENESEDEREDERGTSLKLKLYYKDEVIEKDEIKLKLKNILRHDIDDYLPYMHRTGANLWIDIRTDNRYTFNEIIEKFSDSLPVRGRNKKPDWIQVYLDSAKLHFVQTQRLLKVTIDNRRSHREDNNVTEVIELYSKDIRDRISEKLADSTKVSQSKDRSFPERLLSYKLPDGLTEEKIRKNYKKTESKIDKLMKAGLIEDEKNISLPSKKFKTTEKRVLSLYLEDINEKLSVFDDLLLRIETFLNIVSRKLRNKKLKVTREDGFLIETTQGETTILRPSELSSGEQHEIVLFYELIFKTVDSSFFLIDEPEISLHVDWQRQFLPDISKIAKLGNHSFLIATHSPQIIGSRRDLAIALDGGILSE